MCSLYPAKALKMDNSLGRIEINYKASLVVLSKELNAIKVLEAESIISGQ
jgi:N-acetylglucosamine-6-phosphate deacetylase